MPHQFDGVEARVVNRFHLRAQFERLTQGVETESTQGVYDHHAELLAFTKTELDKRDPFGLTVPPIDRLDIQRQRICPVDPTDDPIERWPIINEFDFMIEHYRYLLLSLTTFQPSSTPAQRMELPPLVTFR